MIRRYQSSRHRHRRPVIWAPGRVQLEPGRDIHLEQKAQHTLTCRSPSLASFAIPCSKARPVLRGAATTDPHYSATLRVFSGLRLQRGQAGQLLIDPTLPVFEARRPQSSLSGAGPGPTLTRAEPGPSPGANRPALSDPSFADSGSKARPVLRGAATAVP